ncbi:MAG: phosphoglycerate transporter protein PgtP [Bacteriovoracia bacterium]
MEEQLPLFSKLAKHLKAQPDAQRITDPETIKKEYKYWRKRIMISSFIGYVVFYFCRKNLSAATPAMITDLQITKTQIGTIWSVLYLSYGVSKLVSGLIGDRSNPRYFMAIGLFLSAVFNLAFGFSTSIVTLAIFWGLNGWVQGMGWPASVRLLTQWNSRSERGFTWGLWNTSHQVGAGAILIVGGFLSQYYGWRSSFFLPAAIAILCSFYLVNRLRDTPESLGLPSVEEFKNDRPDQQEAKPGSIREILFEHVLNNPKIWLLSIGNFFVYIVRYGALDWAPTFLVEVKHSSISNASFKTAFLELVGIGGAIAAGWISDKYFKGKRGPVNFLYMALLGFAVLEFWIIPEGHPVLDACALGAVGFLVYGPQMLVGVATADATSKHAAASATGFMGLFGYIGSIASGIGTGYIVDHYGWNGGFVFFISATILGSLCFIGTWILDYQKKLTNKTFTQPRHIAPAASSDL